MKSNRFAVAMFAIFIIGVLVEYKFSIVHNLRQSFSNHQNTNLVVRKNIQPNDTLKLVIPEKQFQRLMRHQKSALQGRKDFKYVNAFWINGKDSIAIKIRLKGDRSIHFEDSLKLSFRIKVSGAEKMYGVKKFSLHHPGARNYVYEWIFHKALKKAGLIHLKYKFLSLNVNGKNLGLYAFEEHFEQSLLENNNLPKGPILRFNEDYSWFNLYTTYVEPFQTNYWFEKDSALTQQAIYNIEQWRRGEVKTSSVFDVKKLATYFALTDVLWMHHAQSWKSIRFYYNPISKMIEPIGYDGHHNDFFIKNKLAIQLSSTLPLREVDRKYWTEYYRDWYSLLFNRKKSFDPTFYATYVQQLRRLANPLWLDEFFEEIKQELQYNLSLIASDENSNEDLMFNYGKEKFKFSKAIFYERSKEILKIVNDTATSIHAYPVKNKVGFFDLELENTGLLVVKIDSILLDNERIDLAKKNCYLLPHQNNFIPQFDTISLNSSIEKIINSKIYFTSLSNNKSCITRVNRWIRKSK